MPWPDKLRIIQQFSRAARTYDQHCQVQNHICETLIDQLSNENPDFTQVIDIACGTAQSTLRLQQAFDLKHLSALDISERLLERAKTRCGPDIDWQLGDYDQFPIFEHPFDLMFCNMGLQWSSDLGSTLGHWHRHLQPNGILAIALPVAGNFPELMASHKLQMPDFTSIKASLNHLNFQLLHAKQQRHCLRFNQRIDAFRHLKGIGANISAQPLSCGLKHINPNALLSAPQLTYHIGYFIAQKESL